MPISEATSTRHLYDVTTDIVRTAVTDLVRHPFKISIDVLNRYAYLSTHWRWQTSAPISEATSIRHHYYIFTTSYGDCNDQVSDVKWDWVQLSHCEPLNYHKQLQLSWNELLWRPAKLKKTAMIFPRTRSMQGITTVTTQHHKCIKNIVASADSAHKLANTSDLSSQLNKRKENNSLIPLAHIQDTRPQL